jgi:hypothetical protein
MPELFREHRTDKDIYFYDKVNDDYIIYDGCKYGKMTRNEFLDNIRKPYSYTFILVKVPRGLNINNKKDTKKCYKEYIKGIKKVLKKTNINMFRTGSISNTALSIFYKSIKKKNIVSENVKDYEIKYLENGGGVRIGQEYKGNAYKYDINSYYPYLYMSKIIKIPTKKGTLTTINNIDDIKYVSYGIYNIKIYVENKKLFTERDNNIYSHYEINWAKKLNYKMQVIGKHLIFNKDDLISMYDLFNEYVNLLYPYKHKNIMFKKLLNVLWGSLVSKCGGTQTIKGTLDYIDNILCNGNKKLTSIYEHKKGLYTATIDDSNIFYRTNFARLNPFMLGFARCKLHKDIYKVGFDNVVYAHTDSMITTINIFDKLDNDKGVLGHYKYEGHDKECIINNTNNYSFTDCETN